MKILLGREEVNPNKPTNWGQTPLSCAAQHGHEGIVRILLERKEVAPNEPDEFGQTPLMYAVKNGDKKVIALLEAQPSARLEP